MGSWAEGEDIVFGLPIGRVTRALLGWGRLGVIGCGV